MDSEYNLAIVLEEKEGCVICRQGGREVGCQDESKKYQSVVDNVRINKL